jgi:hypothetical protein
MSTPTGEKRQSRKHEGGTSCGTRDNQNFILIDAPRKSINDDEKTSCVIAAPRQHDLTAKRVY